jgi:hypothetical protein
MSVDVFFQGFIAGESSESGLAEMLAVLAPYVTERRDSFLLVQVGDGTADVYPNDAGMMANHVSGNDPWDLLVAGAKAANWVILPMGCPTCLTSPGQREALPEGLDVDIAYIDSGADLRAVIASR